jgi:hypothetical protein
MPPTVAGTRGELTVPVGAGSGAPPVAVIWTMRDPSFTTGRTKFTAAAVHREIAEGLGAQNG